MQPVSGGPVAELPPRARQEEDLRRAARGLEASFLTVMLRESGVGAPRGSFGGGAGEDQFASFLTEAYARKIADRGGLGLSEAIFRALKERADG